LLNEEDKKKYGADSRSSDVMHYQLMFFPM